MHKLTQVAHSKASAYLRHATLRESLNVMISMRFWLGWAARAHNHYIISTRAFARVLYWEMSCWSPSVSASLFTSYLNNCTTSSFYTFKGGLLLCMHLSCGYLIFFFFFSFFLVPLGSYNTLHCRIFLSVGVWLRRSLHYNRPLFALASTPFFSFLFFFLY